MRYWFCFFLSLTVTFTFSQEEENRRKPKITGQKPIATNEEAPVTIQLSDLEVRDRDSWFYPWGFSLRVYEGDNYTLSGHTVIPAQNFSGTLSVPVSVNDGQNESEKYNVQVHVRPINDPPAITGQANISTNEDQAFTIQFSQLVIADPDDTEFTVYISEGANYTISAQTVTPAANFNGTLSIPVRVSDGEALSGTYNLQLPVLAVNDAPKITAHTPLETEENKPITIQFSHLTVTDPDNTYPEGFSMTLQPSTNNTYMVSGSQVTPALNYEGMITVPVTVSDGVSSSEVFAIQIKVNPGKNAPVITGQMPVNTNEDQPIAILFSHLTVSDPDNNYPTGFTLRILTGTNYSATNNIVTPQADFNGPLTVNVTVNDGTSESAVFGMVIGINPVNDAPKIIKLETEPLAYQSGKGAVLITAALEITDAESDSITQAEVAFKPESYRLGIDELIFENNSKIKGTFDRQRALLSLTGRASLTQYIQAIRSIKYNFLAGSDLPFEKKTIVISVSDGKNTSEKAERIISSTNVIINLDIPTAFTPNGDSANDTWSIRPLKQSEEIADALVRIYNKNGVLLFEADGFEKEWDGRLNGELLPADTYYYTIDLNLQYSRTLFKGLVTILR